MAFLAATVHDGGDENILTDYILVIQEFLTLIKVGGILRVRQKLRMSMSANFGWLKKLAQSSGRWGITMDRAIGKPSIWFSNMASYNT